MAMKLRTMERETRIIKIAVDVKEAAELLSVSERTVWRLVSKGDFPRPFSATAGGKGKRWLVSDIDAWAREKAAANESGGK